VPPTRRKRRWRVALAAAVVHRGTFNLAFHAWNAPAEEVLSAASARGVALAIPRPGALVEPSAPPPLETWWR
jgi:hypothetical protein